MNVTPEALLQLGLSFWGAKTFLSAVELGIFTHLSNMPLTLEEVSTKAGLHPRSAADFLDALVSLGVLEREGGRYSNTPTTARYLDRGQETYIGGLFEMAERRLYPFWATLSEALRTGKPQNEARHGGDLFDSLYGDPSRMRSFLSAMTGVSFTAAVAIAERFSWKDYRTFTDVGTAQGGAAVEILRRHPHLSAIGLDLPIVQPVFEEFVSEQGFADRFQFQAGDFFKSDIPSADVVIMGHILHDWGLSEKRELLKKAYDALPVGGALIVYESIIDDDRRSNVFGLLMSLNMLIETAAGFDFTGKDCQGWMTDTGFKQTFVQHLAGPDSMVVGIK